MFCFKQAIEKKSATNRDAHLTFIDLQKAYDNMPTQKLWEVLEIYIINCTLIKSLKRLYSRSTSRVKSGKTISKLFPVTKGLRQGCCISPTFFKIYVAPALKQWKQKVHPMGIQLTDDICLYTIHFAADQVVLTNDKDDMQYMLRKRIEEYNHWGLTVNIERPNTFELVKSKTIYNLILTL